MRSVRLDSHSGIAIGIKDVDHIHIVIARSRGQQKHGGNTCSLGYESFRVVNVSAIGAEATHNGNFCAASN